jgi:hypothetical protein
LGARRDFWCDHDFRDLIVSGLDAICNPSEMNTDAL